MNWTPQAWLELLCFPVAIAAGQILFKRAAAQMAGVSGPWLLELARLPTMWVAVALYAASTLAVGAYSHHGAAQPCISVRGAGIRPGAGGRIPVLR